METIIWRADTAEFRAHPPARRAELVEESFRTAAALLRAGELIVFPTETVYGLGAAAFDPAAVRKIFAVKGRPADNPLIVHVHNLAAARGLSSAWPAAAEALGLAFWPGPLSIVVPAAPHIPHEVTAGLTTVAVRIPKTLVARKLAEYAGPIAAPSANLSGQPSGTHPEHVIRDFDGKIAGIFAAAPAGILLESTVVDVTTPEPVILRPGAVTAADIAAVLGVPVHTAAEHDGPAAPRAPGMKYAHYAPQAPLYLVQGSTDEQLAQFRAALERADLPHPLGLLISRQTEESLGAAVRREGIHIYRQWGADFWARYLQALLYPALRQCDDDGVQLILAESFPEINLGAAYMNRLRKAAAGRIWSGKINY